MQKLGGLAFLFISVSLIIGAIIFTTILGQTKGSASINDVRARAAVEKSMLLTGIVDEVNDATGTVTVSGVKFEGDSGKDLGAWTVTIPSNAQTGALTGGKQVLITVDAKTFKINERTMTATAISPR